MASQRWTAVLGTAALVLIITGLVASRARAVAGAPQHDPGVQARLDDGKIDVKFLPAENRTEVSLGVAPPRPDGGPGVTLLLRASFAGRQPDPLEPADISLRAHYKVHSNDRDRAVQAMGTSHALEFRVDAHAPDGGITLSFFPASWGYVGFSAPGDEIPVAFFTLSAADLRALAVARSLSGRVLWTDFVLSDAQLQALGEFASVVLPPS